MTQPNTEPSSPTNPAPIADDGADRVEPVAASQTDVHGRHQANRAAWNEGAAYYTALVASDIDRLRAGTSTLHPLERAALGNLRAWCGRAVHLQCASGMDTLSLWIEGAAEVVGIDISDAHIANARAISAALNAPAQWYRCDVLETPAELDGTADLVYTGRGAIGWLHDIERWAQTVARLLAPGGMFHLLEDHPLTWILEADGNTVRLTGHDYFNAAFSSKGWPAVYIGDAAGPEEQQTRKYERLWPIASVVNALIAAGLRIEQLGEHNQRYWKMFDGVDESRLARLPLTYTIVARKP